MPAGIVDFRGRPFDVFNVDRSGKDLGRNVYWQLYAVENLVRVLVHSVLSAQVGAAWWSVAVDERIAKKALKRRAANQNTPWHTSPGGHEIYFIDLSDVNEIIRVNGHLFRPVVDDIDGWIARIEQLRVPRNVVAHMNWLSKRDRQRIGVFYADVRSLLQVVADRTTVVIP